MPNNLPPVPPRWKARFKSTLVDVDSALVEDADLRKFLLAGDDVKAGNWLDRHPGSSAFFEHSERITEAAAKGGAVTLVSRCGDKVLRALTNKLPANYVSHGHAGDYRPLMEWLDGNAAANREHVVVTGWHAGAANVADIARRTGANVASVLAGWHAKEDRGSPEENHEAWLRRWAILAKPLTVTQARRQVAVNETKFPVLTGVTDHGGAYANDYFYKTLKDLGLLRTDTPSHKLVYGLKDAARARNAAAGLAAAKDLLGNWMEGRIADRDEPFLIVPIVSSTPVGASETPENYRARQAGLYVAQAVQEASGGKGRILMALTRPVKPDKDLTRKSKDEDSVQVHIESLSVAESAKKLLEDSDVLLVDDLLTDGTQFEAAECLLRIAANPATVTKFALGRTVKGGRHHQASSRIAQAQDKAALARQALISDYEEPPVTYGAARYDPRKAPLAARVA